MTFGKRRNQVPEEAEEEASTEEEEETAKLKINLGELLGGAKDKDPRIIGLFGSVEEEKAGELCYHLITMSEPNTPIIEGEECPPEPLEDITFYVSTYGGSADDMFSIYDVMNFAKRRCDIVNSVVLVRLCPLVFFFCCWNKRKAKDWKELSCDDTCCFCW